MLAIASFLILLAFALFLLVCILFYVFFLLPPAQGDGSSEFKFFSHMLYQHEAVSSATLDARSRDYKPIWLPIS